MNEIAEKSAIAKLMKAMEEEKIGTLFTAKQLGVKDLYITYLKNEKYRKFISQEAWERILKWCNSGKSIKEYKLEQYYHLPVKDNAYEKVVNEVEKNTPAEEVSKLTDDAPELKRDSKEQKDDFTDFFKTEIEKINKSPLQPVPKTINCSIYINLHILLNGQEIHLK